MSQAIKKLEGGGSVSQTEQKPNEETPKVRTFKLGEREIEADSLLRNADSNIESYLESTGWSSKKKNAFRESYGKYLTGIHSGAITSRDVGRNWIDSTGQLTNTSGKGFDANGAVAHYLDSIADIIPDYIKEEKPKETPTKKSLNFGAGLNQSLLDKFFGGNKYNQSVWYGRDTLDEKTKKRGVSNRLKDFSGQFNQYADSILNDPEFDNKYDLSGTAFKNKDELKNRIENARLALSNESILGEDDWQALASLGIDVDQYRQNWFGESDTPTGQQITPTIKKDNYKGTPLEDVSKINPKIIEAGYLPRTDEKENIFYLNPDGTEFNNGVIEEVFNPTTDPLAGHFRVNGNIYDPKDYANWSPEIKNAYNIVLNEKDDKEILDDPLYGELKNQGYSHAAYATPFFENFDGELIKAYTRPTVDNPTGAKSQYYLNDNGKFTPVTVSYDNILGEWVMNNNGTTKRLGRQRQADGKDIGFQKIGQYTFDKNRMYDEDNVLGLLKRLGSNPNLVNDMRYKDFIQGLFTPGVLDRLKAEDGTPLSEYIKKGFIDFKLVPNQSKRGLRILRDHQGRVIGLTFDSPGQENSSTSKSFKPAKNKEGGIIKAQWGAKATTVYDSNKSTSIPELTEEEEKLNKKATNSYDKTQSIKFDNKELTDAGGIIKAADRVKLGAAMADLLSAGLGFVPGANLVSAGVGAASSLATFGADVSDGLEWGDVGSLALNLGMDAVSLIPGLKAVKAGKALTRIMKFVPLLSTAIAASSMFNDRERESLLGSLKKISSGNLKDLGTEDFQNLATISRTVLGGKNYLKSSNGRIMTRLRGTRTLPTNMSEVSVNVKGRNNPLKVQLNNAEIEGKDAGFIESLAKKRAKQQLAKEGMVEKNIPDDALSVETKGTDKWYKGSFLNPKKVPLTKVSGDKVSRPNWVQRNLIPQESPAEAKNFGQFWGMRGINPNGKLGWLSDSHWISNNKKSYLRPTKEEPVSTNKGDKYMFTTPPTQLKPGSRPKNKFFLDSKRVHSRRQADKYINSVGNDYMEPWFNPGRFKQGGIVKAQGGKKIRNVTSNANWGTDIYGTEGFNKWISGYNADNYQDFNNLQKSYYNNLTTTGYKPGNSPVSYNQGVYDRQASFSKAAPSINAAIEGLAKTGKIVRAGVSGDNASGNYTDGYFGGQEYLRHGGMRGILADNQLKDLNTLTSKNGLEYYIDDETGMALLRPSAVQQQAAAANQEQLQEVSNPEASNAPITNSNTPVTNNNGSQTRGVENKAGALKQILGRLDPTSFIQAGRMAGNIWNNNRVAAKTKEGLRPLLLDTYETPRQQVGDLATRQVYNKQAANLESLAARPRTSDASLQLAGELQANAGANQLRMEGALADNDMIRRTGEAAWQNNAEAVARRSDVSNRNRASMLGIDKAKKDIDAARMSANWTSVENFMKEREYKSAMNQDRQRQFDLNVGMGNIQAGTEAKLKPLRDYLEQQSMKGVDISTLPQYKQYSDLVESLSRSNVQDQNELYGRVYGLRTPRSNWYPTYRKGGGQLTYVEKSKLQAQNNSAKARTQNAKLFQKNIEKTVDTNIKMINNLSSVSKQLIIKSMT